MVPGKCWACWTEGKLPKNTNLTAKNAEPYLHARVTDVEVYRVADDIGESADLAQQDPALRQHWLERINAAYRELAEGSHVWAEQ